MNRDKTLAELQKMMREAPAAEAIAFVETLVAKNPELHAPLLAALAQQQKS